jgi:hypothetical protein
MGYIYGMSVLAEWLVDAWERMDTRLPAGLYVAVSVPTEKYRADLRRRGRVFVDPGVADVAPADVDFTARWVIQQTGLTSAGVAGFAATVGAISVPPEAVAQTLAVVRLAQRLAIVYGFDPETERGALLVWRAVARGFGVALPMDGPSDVRVKDLPALFLPRTVSSAGLYVARATMQRSASLLARRIGRMFPVPFITPGISAWRANKRHNEVGERMMASLREAAGLDASPPMAEAVVVRTG